MHFFKKTFSGLTQEPIPLHFTRLIAALILAELLIASASARQPRRDPVTGRVRVLYCGDTARASYAMLVDPMILPTFVPSACLTKGEELNRFMRLYMSRTYDQFVKSYDLVNLGDQQVDHFPPKYLRWFADGVRDQGMGLSMTGGIGGFGGEESSGIGSWEPTPVGEVLPAHKMETKTLWRSYKLVILKPNHPTMKPLPWKTAPPLHGLDIVETRQGASTLAQAGLREGYPVMIWWDIGQGRAYGFTSCLGGGWGYDFIKWQYYMDFVDGFLYFTAGLTVPQDLSIIHAVRNNIMQYKVSKSMMFSLLDFVDDMGGKTQKLEQRVSDIDHLVADAESAYIEQNYQDSLSKTREALAGLDRLDREAMELKDQTLLWTYVIEWLSVSGVSGLVGWIVYELMIRRRLYRGVESTRLGAGMWKGS